MIADLGTILGVWAHPDDECYLSGGIMAAAVRAGQRVVCVTATRGEAADPDRWPPEELARIREAELDACLAVLGVREHRWLDYPDGGCAAIDPDEAVARLAAIITDVQPDTVLTFPPDGMTGHPDHCTVCAWTARAVEVTGTGAALYFATHTPEWTTRFDALGRELDVMMNDDVNIPATPAEALAINLPVVGELLALKERAMLQQATQVERIRASLGPELYRELLVEEVFRHP